MVVVALPSPCFVSFRADAYDSISRDGLRAHNYPYIRAAATRLEAKLAYERWRPAADQNKMRIVSVDTKALPAKLVSGTPTARGVRIDAKRVARQHLCEFYDGNAVGYDLLESEESKGVLVDAQEGVAYLCVEKGERSQILASGYQPRRRASVPVSLTHDLALEAGNRRCLSNPVVLRLNIARLAKDLVRICRDARGYALSSFARSPGNANATPNTALLQPHHFLHDGEDPFAFLLPSELRFTQDSIKAEFRDGRSLAATTIQIASGQIEKRDVEMVRVVHDGNNYCALDNRRLACFRLLEICGRAGRIKCRVLPMRGMSAVRPEIKVEFDRKADQTADGRRSIRIRGDYDWVIGTDRGSTRYGPFCEIVEGIGASGSLDIADVAAFMAAIDDE